MRDKSKEYEAWGPVRGSCGHHHRSIKDAVKCMLKDRGDIRKAYPSRFPTRTYSDRIVRHADGSPLSPDEFAEAIRIEGDILTR